MLKKLSLALAFSSMLLTNIAIAKVQPLQMGATITYELLPQEPLELFNFTFWTLEATCLISTEDEANDIYAELLNRTGTINGKSLTAGDIFTVTVRRNDALHISAESRARIKLTNLGANKIIATCST
ncbi:MAG: hypothetical protein JJT82_08050 [Legionellaceae bacterium]|nr:hypothetical protein [Legionellaceae bacterium]